MRREPGLPLIVPSEGGSAARPVDLSAAVARGIRFLQAAQLPDGAFRVYTAKTPDMAGATTDDASVFPTALIAHCLSFAPAATAMTERAVDFLSGEMDPHGLWRHWAREHPLCAQLPPDLDDTSCASAALLQARRPFPDNRRLLLANRTSDGLFFTWFVPRPRLATLGPLRATLSQLLHAPTLWLFFARTSAAPGDVDAVVNANAVAYLGPGSHVAPVVALLLEILRAGRERQCDKWYENPFAVRYFFARALGGSIAEAAGLIEVRTAEAEPASALEAAMAIAALAIVRRSVPAALVGRLLDAQRMDGSWPAWGLYHGGRKRLKDGSFAPPHPDTPHWGSEELTTGFCIEALARAAQSRRR